MCILLYTFIAIYMLNAILYYFNKKIYQKITKNNKKVTYQIFVRLTVAKSDT